MHPSYTEHYFAADMLVNQVGNSFSLYGKVLINVPVFLISSAECVSVDAGRIII